MNLCRQIFVEQNNLSEIFDHTSDFNIEIDSFVIKNYLLSYEDVTIRKSWRNERFMYHGRPVVKFWIHGNIIDAYINLDFDKLRNTRYEVQDMRGKKLHDNTPVLFKVSTHKAVIQLKELIDIHMQEVGAIKGKE